MRGPPRARTKISRRSMPVSDVPTRNGLGTTDGGGFMTSKQARGLGLVLATILWCSLTGWVLVVAQADGPPVRRDPGYLADQEPPPARSVWDRVTGGVHALFRPHHADPARDAVRDALGALGATPWHQAGHRGKGV